jgi:hypothetical protein
MTPDERIDRAVELLPRGELSEYTRQLWRTTIETAVEEEREAILTVAKAEGDEALKLRGDYARGYAAACYVLEEKIRARGNKK